MEQLDTDATGLAELVRRGDVHPRELVDAAIAAIEAQDGAINAVVQRRFEQARDEAGGPLPDGPFRGVPFLLKDYGAEVAGEPYHEGMAFLRDRGWRAEADSALAAAFRAAGLVNLGRTNLPELALMGTTEPAASGRDPQPVGARPLARWQLGGIRSRGRGRAWSPRPTPTTSRGPSGSRPRTAAWSG